MTTLQQQVTNLLDRFEASESPTPEYRQLCTELQRTIGLYTQAQGTPQVGDRVCWIHVTDGAVCGRLSCISALGFCTVDRFATNERYQIRIDQLWHANGH